MTLKRTIAALAVLLAAIFHSPLVYGATIFLTQTSDTLGTFRTNVNTSLTNLNSALPTGVIISTTTNLSAGQAIYATGASSIGGVATSAITISSPLTSSGTAGFVFGGSSWALGCQTAS